jgi:predicted 3-demethylubiquinone-9 3-methyltransferase (glyoxalase superfamily)
MQKITPFLWFDTQAEEAARFWRGCPQIPQAIASAPLAAETMATGAVALQSETADKHGAMD